ncbi:unnamed protein product [Phytophthora lilii]|uniref:Unnamed protein product n=1 Tax=Phytophthora lilii TaxID=2077276 RepID=A0A9W6XA53_9STRA|nr:unnamed protein product [Phytophthora lilii]
MYKDFPVDLSHAQAVKVLHGKPVRLSHSQLNKGHAHYFHPENYKTLVKAYESGKGTTLHMSHGEVLRTHQSGLSGSGFWGSLWNGINLPLRESVASLKTTGSQSLLDFWMYGPYEFKIILIKQYEVADRSQLLAYETLWINKYKKTCVNKVLPFGLLKRQRQQEDTRKYWEANKEVLNEKNKRYNELHKERLSEKVTCGCGSQYQLRGRTYHFKYKKHIRWAEAQ